MLSIAITSATKNGISSSFASSSKPSAIKVTCRLYDNTYKKSNKLNNNYFL